MRGVRCLGGSAGRNPSRRLPRLAAALESVPPGAELHVHFEELSYIDHACLDLLMNWEKQHDATGGSLVIDWETLEARFRQYGRRPEGSKSYLADAAQVAAPP